MKYTRKQIEQLAAAEDARLGLPTGLTASIIEQESGFQDRFLVDKRVPHYTGPKPKSSAAGLGGFLDGTVRDPGYGVKPLGDDWSIPNQLRFIADYASARIKRAGGLEKGLMEYGTGRPEYAQSVLGRLGWRPDTEQAAVAVPREQAVPQQVEPMTVASGSKPPIQRFGEGLDTRLGELNAMLNAQNQAVIPQEYTKPVAAKSNYEDPFWKNFRELTGIL